MSRSALSDTSTSLQWTPLDPESIVSASCLIEQTLCVATETTPRRAKDYNYAKAVLDAWKEQETDSESLWQAEMADVVYESDETDHGQKLYGHVVRNPKTVATKLPVILFFHTGAGPHDIFLFWKAAALVQDLPCIVLICDILGDESGSAWDTDRSWYNSAREAVLNQDDSGRPLLQSRIKAAIGTAESKLGNLADSSTLGAMGWCLGGHPVLELGRMKLPNMLCMATFHGVFDSLPPPPTTVAPSGKGEAEVLICHGVDDPFVTNDILENALSTLHNLRHRTSLLQLQARHGFSNPAQDFNSNPAFAFTREAADKAWHQSVVLMKRVLGG